MKLHCCPWRALVWLPLRLDPLTQNRPKPYATRPKHVSLKGSLNKTFLFCSVPVYNAACSVLALQLHLASGAAKMGVPGLPSKKRVPSGQLAVAEGCSKSRTIASFAQKERARGGQPRRSEQAPALNGWQVAAQKVEDVLVSPIRCPSKQQEARERLRNVGQGISKFTAGVASSIGGAGAAATRMLASLQQGTKGGVAGRAQ